MRIILRPHAVAKLVEYFVPGQTVISKDEAHFYAMFILGIMVTMSFYDTHIGLAKSVLALEMRMAFSSLVYRKALKLHPSVLSEMSTGKIVTLITKDLQAIDSAVHFANDCWVEVLIGMFIAYLIYQKVGLAALVILVSFIIVFPLQGTLGFCVFKKRRVANKRSDERIQFTQEILSVIRIIKMYTWEKFFTDKLIDARKKEVNSIRTLMIFKQGGIFMGELMGKLGYNLLLIVYLLLGHSLTPGVVYYIQSSYHKLRFILTYLITLSMTEVAELLASFNRIENLFNAEEFQPSRHYKQTYIMTRILMRNAHVKLGDQEILRDLTFNLENGLNIIAGPVGCGKSTLVKALLHEYKLSSGTLFVNGEISYASQQPWLFPSTVRQNILFGSDYNDERYKKVLEVCALKLDLKLFPNSDMTVVAESGSNLSKGQQARVNLARAVYKESDIYVLDDCFSALDVNVQNFIFNNCIKDFLKNKLVVLVTHNTSFLNKADHVTILSDGKMAYSGKFDDVAIKNYINELNITEIVEEKIEAESNAQINLANGCSKVDEKGKKKVVKTGNIYSEDMKVGTIGLEVYKRYIAYGTWGLFVFLIFLHISVEGLYATTEKLISKWVNEQKTNATTLLPEENPKDREAALATIMLLSLLTGASVFAKFFRAIVHLIFSMKISRNIHSALAQGIVYARVQFFDRNLIGNILNRFSRDLGHIDEFLPHVVGEVIKMTFMVVSTVGLVVTVNLRFLYYSIILFVVMMMSASFFMPSARSIRRLEAVSRSPMIGHLNSTIEGLISVRAFKKQEILRSEFDEHQNYHTSAQFIGMVTWKVLQLYCHVICALYVGAILVTFMMFKSDFQAGDVGLSLSTAVGLGLQLQWGIRNVIQLESTMTCVERVLEYIDEPQEEKNGKKVENWPDKGSVSFEKVDLRYPLNSQPVLKNINLHIHPKEKVGIVGRTGAGKSSIIVALFRFYDVDGEISIDRENIAEVSLDSLRQGISIIPQEPVIFSGSIRSNIDPTGKYTDEEIWQSLETVNLKGIVSNLDAEIDPKVCGYSLGEKQLISIARAVIRQNKIVVLDEATANMDKETEIEINTKIKEIFKNCTLLIIAHRMETILDCDKVIVMDQGEVVEFDSPLDLARREDSRFYEIIRKTGALNTYLQRTS
ncbi:probable multidrug resistance-associated protein lethal(2)03659 isoform X2 [Coccinella septempunctata]|uniref:probable multidrug resistance-associated protein lethal(2)03659 isoform X2 n=1 Tax=Coccinella septempunctata TaxID=41139 RepID=UPI001D070CEF|nr:probable multidrug resistance-associated protein lethal(2)03659 isoform X2 [Coccinella septempunctata]